MDWDAKRLFMTSITWVISKGTTLQWRHNERDGVSNHQSDHCLPERLFRRRSKKTSKLRVTGLCEGDSRVTGEFPAQSASNVQNVSIWWRHHDQQPAGKSYRCTWSRVSPLSGLISGLVQTKARGGAWLSLSSPWISKRGIFFLQILS